LIFGVLSLTVTPFGFNCFVADIDYMRQPASITHCLVFHERTKYIEVDYHFIREKLEFGDITARFVNSNEQLADIFTKSLSGVRIYYICIKLSTYMTYMLQLEREYYNCKNKMRS